MVVYNSLFIIREDVIKHLLLCGSAFLVCYFFSSDFIRLDDYGQTRSTDKKHAYSLHLGFKSCRERDKTLIADTLFTRERWLD